MRRGDPLRSFSNRVMRCSYCLAPQSGEVLIASYHGHLDHSTKYDDAYHDTCRRMVL